MAKLVVTLVVEGPEELFKGLAEETASEIGAMDDLTCTIAGATVVSEDGMETYPPGFFDEE